ncbi:cytochrome c [Hymenobacter sp. BT730]|uniref:c-type cytochrome n=1 Tax=Hymenobacter sp. BT730 TaxID=3063332 RepID=UPI0026DF98FC|nr:cytochrome c [Hymenobacter sp. BT730]
MMLSWYGPQAFFILLSSLLVASCSSSPTEAPAATPAASAPAELPGKALFATNCALCHGPDGKRGLNGAHDLTKSNLNQAGRVYMVTNGLGKMPAFKGQLTPEQIEQVAAYSLTLQ